MPHKLNCDQNQAPVDKQVPRVNPLTSGVVEADRSLARRTQGLPISLLLFIGLVVMVSRIPFLSLSVMDWDESAFILSARELLQGHLPYTTFFDVKPAGSTFLISAFMLMSSESVEAVRVFSVVCVFTTACLLCSLTQRLTSNRLTALAAALFYVVFSVKLNGIALMTEILLAPFTVAGVLVLMLGERQSAGKAVLTFSAAGLLFGVSVWIKYVPAVPALLVMCSSVIVFYRSGSGLSYLFACIFGFAMALLVPTFVTVLIYWWSGNLEEFLYSNFGFVGRYVATADPWHERLGYVAAAVREILPLVLAVGAALYIIRVVRHLFTAEQKSWAAVICLWLAGELVAAVLPLHFYPHYFLMILPPACILAALVIDLSVRRFAAASEVSLSSVLAIALVALYPVIRHVHDAIQMLSHPDVPRQIANIIDSQKRRGDRIYVVDYHPIVYFLTHTPLPTRYAFPDHLVGSQQALLNVDPHVEVQRILDSKPKFIVVDLSLDGSEYDPQARSVVGKALADRYDLLARLPKVDAGSVQVFALRE